MYGVYDRHCYDHRRSYGFCFDEYTPPTYGYNNHGGQFMYGNCAYTPPYYNDIKRNDFAKSHNLSVYGFDRFVDRTGRALTVYEFCRWPQQQSGGGGNFGRHYRLGISFSPSSPVCGIRPKPTNFDCRRPMYGVYSDQGEYYYDNNYGYQRNGQRDGYGYYRRDGCVDRAQQRGYPINTLADCGYNRRGAAGMSDGGYYIHRSGMTTKRDVINRNFARVDVPVRRDNAAPNTNEDRIIPVTVQHQKPKVETPAHEERENEVIPTDQIVLSPTPELLDCAQEEEFEHVEQTEDDEHDDTEIAAVAEEIANAVEKCCDDAVDSSIVDDLPHALTEDVQSSDPEADWEQL